MKNRIVNKGKSVKRAKGEVSGINHKHTRGVFMYLQQIFGPYATYRDGQEEAIAHVLNKQRVLVVQKTGWGKSLVYFLATKKLRERGEGVTLIISPLIALTRNQIQSVAKYGLHADCINSQTNKTDVERQQLIDKCNNGLCDVIFITPEQLEKESFVKMLAQLRVGLFVVDEAHCISDWGHDFRPDYRRIRQLLQVLPSNIAVLATTATANNRVIEDIKTQLGECKVLRGPLKRESLHLHKVNMPTRESKYAWLAKNIPLMPGSGIIYGTTIKECKAIAEWLQSKGIGAVAYHANLREEDKLLFEQQLENNELKVLVSTIALGMGYDKEDIGFVVHFYTPKSIVEYYQQIGRAGRAIKEAICVLLYGGEQETRINDFFINQSFPNQLDFNEILAIIEQGNTVKHNNLLAQVNIKNSTAKQILKLLLLDGIIAKDKDGAYYRTVKSYIPQETYYEAIRNIKRIEFNELLEYQKTNGCLMEYLTSALDDVSSTRCGKCSNCMGKWNWTQDLISEEEIKDVQNYFSKSFNIIQPREKSAITNLKLRTICEDGLALSYYHETLGQEASKGKYVDGYFSNELVIAASEKLNRFLAVNNVNMQSIVIVPIPSNRRPRLVADFALKLATRLDVAYNEALAKHPNEPEQKTMLSSGMQEQNVRHYLYVKDELPFSLDNKHIVLVDDFVDSRWTFAIAADMLGERFQNIKVTPFALASTSND